MKGLEETLAVRLEQRFWEVSGLGNCADALVLSTDMKGWVLPRPSSPPLTHLPTLLTYWLFPEQQSPCCPFYAPVRKGSQSILDGVTAREKNVVFQALTNEERTISPLPPLDLQDSAQPPPPF